MIRAAQRLATVAIAMLVAFTAGCVEHPGLPPRTDGAYEKSSILTADAANSAVATVALVLDAESTGITMAYRDETVSDAEDELDATVGSFSALQPPTDRSVERRDVVMDVLDEATSTVANVRIALRLGRVREALDQRQMLERISSELEGLSSQ